MSPKCANGNIILRVTFFWGALEELLLLLVLLVLLLLVLALDLVLALYLQQRPFLFEVFLSHYQE